MYTTVKPYQSPLKNRALHTFTYDVRYDWRLSSSVSLLPCSS